MTQKFHSRCSPKKCENTVLYTSIHFYSSLTKLIMAHMSINRIDKIVMHSCNEM